jgi:hypothetical protein
MPTPAGGEWFEPVARHFRRPRSARWPACDVRFHLPTVTARAQQEPTVPDAVRTQHGPGSRAYGELGKHLPAARHPRMAHLTGSGDRPLLTVADHGSVAELACVGGTTASGRFLPAGVVRVASGCTARWGGDFMAGGGARRDRGTAAAGRFPMGTATGQPQRSRTYSRASSPAGPRSPPSCRAAVGPPRTWPRTPLWSCLDRPRSAATTSLSRQPFASFR